jgi:hypothetical protein
MGGTGSVAPAIKNQDWLEIAAAIKKPGEGRPVRGCKQVFSAANQCAWSNDAVPTLGYSRTV